MNGPWVGWIEFGTLIAEATIALVLIPELLRYFSEYHEREERIRLNIETFDPRKISEPIFGVDRLIDDIRDVIDRVRHPKSYMDLDVGNEILVVGTEQAGKKALALHIAKLSDIDRVIVVYNPRDADVLARAKSMVDNRLSWLRRFVSGKNRMPGSQKTMLLLPGLDPANGNKGEAWCDQLEALIETASSLPHVLVVGTAIHYERKGEVASWFGTVLPLPEENTDAWHDMMKRITEGFLDSALRGNYRLQGIDSANFVRRILDVAPNPAEVKDIFAQCKTLATYRQRRGIAADLLFTPEILDIAIDRVVPQSA